MEWGVHLACASALCALQPAVSVHGLHVRSRVKLTHKRVDVLQACGSSATPTLFRNTGPAAESICASAHDSLLTCTKT